MATGSLTAGLDALDDPVLTCNADGTIVEWNQSLPNVTGYSEAELRALSLPDLFEQEGPESTATALATALEEGERTVTTTLLTKDGERIPYQVDIYRISTGDDEGDVVAIGRESTARAVTAQKEILDRMSDALFAVDRDWRIRYTNETARTLLATAMGRDEDAVIEGSHLWEEIPDAVDTRFYEKYHEALETQEQVTFEEYYPPMDRWFDVRVYPSETGLSIYVQDVTERRQQRTKLETRERVVREMYQIVADRHRPFEEKIESLLALGRAELGVDYGTLSRIEGEDYVFEYVDASDGGIQAGDVVPLSATNCELTAKEQRTIVLGDIERDAPGETDRAGFEEWGISCYIGAPVFVDDDVYGTFCFYDTEPRDGRFSEWEVTLVDLMSRWVSYELQHQQATERLERQNEKLERFAGLVSHDLRNPLNVLQGSIQLAEETGDDVHFERASGAVERMDALIDDLLSLARAGEGIETTDAVDLAATVELAWETVPTSAATLAVATDRTIAADGTRLQQLLENLIRNAIEHGGESVTVTVGDLPDGFFVADDGPGIDQENYDVVFESGFSTNTDGTGFGLAIVSEIAEAHGWTVQLTDSETGGARFEFTGVATVDATADLGFDDDKADTAKDGDDAPRVDDAPKVDDAKSDDDLEAADDLNTFSDP